MTPAALGAVSLDHAQVRFVATEPAVDERGHLLTMQRAQALDRELLLQLVEATPAVAKADALNFLAKLHRSFNARRIELLALEDDLERGAALAAELDDGAARDALVGFARLAVHRHVPVCLRNPCLSSSKPAA